MVQQHLVGGVGEKHEGVQVAQHVIVGSDEALDLLVLVIVVEDNVGLLLPAANVGLCVCVFVIVR